MLQRFLSRAWIAFALAVLCFGFVPKLMAAAYVCVRTAPANITFSNLDLVNASNASATTSFTVGADAKGTFYDVWLSVGSTNIDTTNNVYLAKNSSGNAIPLNVLLSGSTSNSTVSANSAAIQTGGSSTARPTTGSAIDGSHVRGTDSVNSSTTYIIQLTENTSLMSTYSNAPAGSYSIPITVNVALYGQSGGGAMDSNKCISSTSSLTGSASIIDGLTISTALTNISMGSVDLLDSTTTTGSGTFTVKANGTATDYDVWLSVPQANLDATNNWYLATNGSNKLPLAVALTGNSGTNAVNANSAAIQTGAASTARPTSNVKADGDGVTGTSLAGTTYTATLSEISNIGALYPNIPAGTYSVTITANIAHGN